MRLKERLVATIAAEGITDRLISLYEHYPEFRGKSPNRIVNIAFEEWVDQKLNKFPASARTIPPMFSSSNSSAQCFFAASDDLWMQVTIPKSQRIKMKA